MSDKNDEQFEADELIDSLYKDHAGEQPPVSLDNLILAKARGQTSEGSAYRKTRWHIPVALCMVPAIALAVVLKLGNFGRGGDLSGFESADSSSVYTTEEFVLHIPRASDAIARPEKPDFSEELMASNEVQSMAVEAHNNSRAAPAVRAEVIAEAEAAINVPVTRPERTKRAAADVETVTADMSQALQGAPVASEPSSGRADQSVADEVMVAAAPAPASFEMADAVAAAPADADIPMPASAPSAATMGRAAPESAQAQAFQSTEKIRVSREDDYQECPPREERGEMCPDVYQPVCGERDTGVRCMMAPCSEATELKTYSNACYACADLDVYGYFAAGICEDLIIESAQ